MVMVLQVVATGSSNSVELVIGTLGTGTLGTGQRFTPKKRTVPVICFESEIDRLVYQLYGLTEEEIKIVEQS